MSTSLFGALTSYIPTEKRNPREDYLTELFAWLLSNVDEYKENYVRFLFEKMKKPGLILFNQEIAVSTQEIIPGGRIDLMIRIGDDIGLVCEHKVYSELSENQIGKYMDYFRGKNRGQYYSVLLTLSTAQHTQKADVSIVWQDIYDFTLKLLPQYESENYFLLQQFTAYLKEDVLEMFEPITKTALQAYWNAVGIERSLETLFQEIVSYDWTRQVPGLETFSDGEYCPAYKKYRWGRLGIQFFNEWSPTIFAGVLLDPSDHHLAPKDPSKGPEFVILVDSDDYKKLKETAWYHEKCKILAKNHGDFDYMPGIPDSPWRVIVLRKALYDVLNGAETKEEQEKALIEAVVSGLNCLMQGNTNV